jgi:ubiquitin C-terminal hydrolase
MLQPRVSCGLANIGNTCYSNTLIQCLRTLRRFMDALERVPVRANTTPYLVDEMRRLYYVMNTEKGITPSPFLKTLHKLFPDWDINHQNDIHEYFLQLLNRLIYETTTALPKLPDELQPRPNTKYEIVRHLCETSWRSFFEKEYSPIVDMFYGQSIVQIICGNCKKIHHNYQPFCVLEVSINERTTHLTHCLGEHQSQETLNEDPHAPNQWTCDVCRVASPSVKTTEIWRLPPVLVIDLKRFSTNGRRCIKNIQRIQIPVVLGAVPLSTYPRRLTYNLRAVANHRGGLNSGHYWALCRHPTSPDVVWNALNDGSVKEGVPFDDRDAYLVFYELA